MEDFVDHDTGLTVELDTEGNLNIIGLNNRLPEYNKDFAIWG